MLKNAQLVVSYEKSVHGVKVQQTWACQRSSECDQAGVKDKQCLVIDAEFSLGQHQVHTAAAPVSQAALSNQFKNNRNNTFKNLNANAINHSHTVYF